MVTRLAGITSPSASGVDDGSSGVTKEMNFWPKSVVGKISTETLSGICSASCGLSATVITACSPSWSTLRTCPTSTPWMRTSPNLVSWSPARSALIFTVVTSVNTFWYIAIDSATSSAITVRNATPATISRRCSAGLSW